MNIPWLLSQVSQGGSEFRGKGFVMSQDEIDITINGTRYAGIRTITGNRYLWQTISYCGIPKPDTKRYTKTDSGSMDTAAKVILGELVHEIEEI